MPVTSRIVGVMSMTSTNWVRIAPLSAMPLGHAMMSGSLAAAVQVLLVALERRVACHGPTLWVIRETAIGPDVAQALDRVGRGGLFESAEPGELVQASLWAPLLAGAVVRAQDDDRVVEPADLGQIMRQPADLAVGMVEESRVRGLKLNEECFLVLGQAVPRPDPVVPRRELSLPGHDAELLLPGETTVANLVPSLLEERNVFVEISLRDLVRRMAPRPGQRTGKRASPASRPSGCGHRQWRGRSGLR